MTAKKKSAGRTAQKKAAPTKKGAGKSAAARKKPSAKAPAKKSASKKVKPAAAKKPSKASKPIKAKAAEAPSKKAPAAEPSKRGLEVRGAVPKAPPSKAGASKGDRGVSKSNGAAAPSGRGMLPPPKSRKGGDVLTLVPARSSQSGSAHPAGAPAPKESARARTAPPGRGVTLVRRASDRPAPGVQSTALPIPVRKVEAPPSVEERFSRIEKRLEALDEASRREFYGMFDQAWVSHDSALEGTVYTREEIQAGFSAEPILTDSSLQPAADEIRRHREAIEYVRDSGLRKRLPVTVDVMKKIFLILHPSEGDLKTVKYRRDVPQHRLYFHEYAPPDKIAYKVRQIIDWLGEPETRKKNALRVAARVHYDLVRVFPFQSDSGKVARLFMNLLLYRAGYPPAIIHAKERQGYYEALKGEPNRILRIVQDSVEDGLASIEKFLDEQDARKRPFVI
ncbi:MAG: hypothetical protein HOW73_10995 [Polyangiaceae bacterium]|nr:hypothetical protein [Polyangiaceae bacterium]